MHKNWRNKMVDNKIDDDLQDRIGVVPEHVMMIANKGKAGVRNAKIAVALNSMKSGNSIIYSEKEFLSTFGKNGKATLVSALKKLNVSKPAVHTDNGKVYVFSRGEV